MTHSTELFLKLSLYSNRCELFISPVHHTLCTSWGRKRQQCVDENKWKKKGKMKEEFVTDSAFRRNHKAQVLRDQHNSREPFTSTRRNSTHPLIFHVIPVAVCPKNKVYFILASQRHAILLFIAGDLWVTLPYSLLVKVTQSSHVFYPVYGKRPMFSPLN